MKKRLFITLVLIVALCFTSSITYGAVGDYVYYETETNDYITSADMFLLGQTWVGCIKEKDVDCYKLTLDKETKLIITCVAQKNTAAFGLYNNLEELLYASQCSIYSEDAYAGLMTVVLNPGTYYVAVVDINEGNTYNNYVLYAEDFRELIAPQITVSTVDETGKPIVKWDAIEGATCYEIWRSVGDDEHFQKYYTTEYCSFTNASARAGTTYYYKVRTVVGDEYSAFSEAKAITCDLEQPKNVKVKNNETSGKPKLTWDAVEGADKYYVYRATSKNGTYSYLGSTVNTHYTNTGAEAGKTYYYIVYAVDADNEYATSAQSESCYITCDLPQPKNVKVNNNVSSGKPKVTWTAVEGADKYYVYRATSKNGTYSYLGSTVNTHYTNTSAEAGKTYYYKVKAVNVDNEYGNSALSNSCYVTCDLARPTNVQVTLSNDKPKVTWNKVEGATKYEVYRKVGENGTYKKFYTTVYTSFTNTGATVGTKYYYKVVAVCGSNSYGNSAYSNAVSITSK